MKGDNSLPKKSDLSGEKFGKLTVVGDSGDRTKQGVVLWQCKCDCGNIIKVPTNNLNRGHTKSCGCLKGEVKEEWKRIHSIYHHMKERCFNETHVFYKNYGGRGISVCDEWADKHGFYKFKDWALAHGYKDNLTLDRIDHDGDYCPENCRFVDMKTQQNNRRNNFYITMNGETKTLMQWCEQYNAPYNRTRQRLKRDGWSIQDALFLPSYGKREETKHG